MGVTDPRKLAIILHDLESELDHWAMKANDIRANAISTQAMTAEAVARARHREAIVAEKLKEDEQDFTEHERTVNRRLDEAKHSVSNAQNLLQDTEEKIALATKTLERWQKELELALNWQRLAEDRVRKAREWEARAVTRYNNAVNQYNRALAAYNTCQNTVIEHRNNNGDVVRTSKPDCSSQASAVRSADAEVSRAKQDLEAARAELDAAQAELGRAMARVNACNRAVDLCQQGVRRANESKERAVDGLGQAQRALESAESAFRTTSEARKTLAHEQDEVDQMHVQMRQSADHLDHAAITLMRTNDLEEKAQTRRLLARSELQYRRDILYALNNPEMLGSINGSGGSGAAGTFIGGKPGGGGPIGSNSGTIVEDLIPKDPTNFGIWLTTDVVMPVVNLPSVPELDDDSQQKKFDMETFRIILLNLAEMMPFIKDGIGTNIDYWIKRDEETGTLPKTGYQAAFRSFYGSTPITIAQLDDGTYFIINGAERVWVASKIGAVELPVKLKRRPAYARPHRLQDNVNQPWEIRVYDSPSGFSLRVFNLNERMKIPTGITDGDGACLNVTLGQNAEAVVSRFDNREKGFDESLLKLAESICVEKSITNLYFVYEQRDLNDVQRDWLKAHNYQFNVENQRVTAYKILTSGRA